VLFRHALSLAGVEAPPDKREVIRLARERFGFEGAPFERLLDVRAARLKAREIDAAALLPGYLAGIGAVIDAVNRLEK
jgi:hypothetical protein